MLFNLCATAQIERYVFDLKGKNGKYDMQKAYGLIRKDPQKNIFLLSEYAHDFRILDKLRTDLVVQILKNDSIEKIFYENTWEHDTLLKKYYNGSLLLNDYKKFAGSNSNDTAASWFHLLEDDYKRIENSNFEYLIKSAIEHGYANKLIGLDIGTITFRLGLHHLCKLTQSLKENHSIKHFCDSLLEKYTGEFSTMQYVDSEDRFVEKKHRIDLFLYEMSKRAENASIVQVWKSVFSIYLLANFNRSLSLPVIEGGHILTTKEFMEMNSFRDSVMYDNFKYFLPPTWNNVILLFSTLHLMDTNNQKEFSDVLSANSRTLGRFLHNEYRPYLRRIAFICNSGMTKSRGESNLNYKKSLEYKLSKNYEIAYVDLDAYRNSKEIKEPFYMRPTFFTFRKLNWENLFDGIVFVKDCNCMVK
jgi:hypothetical protein